MSRIYNQIIHLSWSGACALHTKLYKHRTKAQESVRTICIVEVPRGFLCLANLPPFSLVLPMSGNSLWLELSWKSIALDFPKRGKMTRWALRLRLFQDLLSIGPSTSSWKNRSSATRCNRGLSWINSSLKDGKLRRRSCASAGQPHLKKPHQNYVRKQINFGDRENKLYQHVPFVSSLFQTHIFCCFDPSFVRNEKKRNLTWKSWESDPLTPTRETRKCGIPLPTRHGWSSPTRCHTKTLEVSDEFFDATLLHSCTHWDGPRTQLTAWCRNKPIDLQHFAHLLERFMWDKNIVNMIFKDSRAFNLINLLTNRGWLWSRLSCMLLRGDATTVPSFLVQETRSWRNVSRPSSCSARWPWSHKWKSSSVADRSNSKPWKWRSKISFRRWPYGVCFSVVQYTPEVLQNHSGVKNEKHKNMFFPET